MVNISDCLFIVVLVGTVLCVAASKEVRDSQPGYCHYQGISIKDGESAPAPIGSCKKLYCRITENGEKYLRILSCPQFMPMPGCHKSKKDLTKHFPHCCPHSICPDEDK